MSRQMLKWGIDPAGCSHVTVHAPGTLTGVYHVADQHGELTLWGEVENDLKHCERRFEIYGTGHRINDGNRYIGSAVVGRYVWHVYEVLP